MSLSQRDYLSHILAEADYLVAASQDFTLGRFIGDETMKRAFVRSIEIIGEATKKLPSEITSDQSVVPWTKIARMRDRLVHGYFGVDHELVWDVATQSVPTLRREVLRLLSAKPDEA